MGESWNIIIGESEKKKGEKSDAPLTEKKRGKNKSNHPDDEAAGKKTIIIITLMRIVEERV